MKVDEAIEFLKTAKEKTFSETDKYWLANAIETLYHMKECGRFKEGF